MPASALLEPASALLVPEGGLSPSAAQQPALHPRCGLCLYIQIVSRNGRLIAGSYLDGERDGVGQLGTAKSEHRRCESRRAAGDYSAPSGTGGSERLRMNYRSWMLKYRFGTALGWSALARCSLVHHLPLARHWVQVANQLSDGAG